MKYEFVQVLILGKFDSSLISKVLQTLSDSIDTIKSEKMQLLIKLIKYVFEG